MRFPVVMIIVSYLILILTDFLIFKDIGIKLKNLRESLRKPGAIGYGIFALLVFALLTVTVCLPKKSVDVGINTPMWLLYIFLTIILSQLIYCLFSLIGYLPLIFGQKKWKTGLWIGLPLAILVFLTLWYGAFIGRYKIDTTYVEVSSSRLPETFDGYKIAQISDLHLGTWGNDTLFISSLVDSVMALKPDMIVFTGDAVNRVGDEFKPFIKPLSRLKASDGVYTILGNHDYGDYVKWPDAKAKAENLVRLKSYQKEAGWEMLDNSYKPIINSHGDSIMLLGVGNWGEPPFSQYGDLKTAYRGKNLRDDNFKILLSHNPRHWDNIVSEESNIDLTLSGHTHAMQMELELGDWKWSPSQYIYDQWGGLYSRENNQKDQTHLYVNIGAGEVGMPMRVGASPEITLITLKKD